MPLRFEHLVPGREGIVCGHEAARVAGAWPRRKTMSLVDQTEPTASNVTPLPSAKLPEDAAPQSSDLRILLKNARNLLLYAGDEGIEVEEKIVRNIISAGSKDELTNEETIQTITSIAALTDKLRTEAHKA